MATLTTIPGNTQQEKLNLEKILWAIKKSESKRKKLKIRETRVQRALEKSDLFLFVLMKNLKKTLASLNEIGWDQAAFEARTGLKLPDP